jgi:hypothetical protein
MRIYPYSIILHRLLDTGDRDITPPLQTSLSQAIEIN